MISFKLEIDFYLRINFYELFDNKFKQIIF